MDKIPSLNMPSSAEGVKVFEDFYVYTETEEYRVADEGDIVGRMECELYEDAQCKKIFEEDPVVCLAGSDLLQPLVKCSWNSE